MRREDDNKTANRQKTSPQLSDLLLRWDTPDRKKLLNSQIPLCHLQSSHREPPADPGTRRAHRCRREASASCAATRPGVPGSCRPSLAPRSPSQSHPGSYLGQARVSDGPCPGWCGEGGREAPPRSPRPGRAAPHAGQRGWNAWPGHSAAQAVAPVRAASWEAAPRLGVTISPATQCRPKTSPSSTAVISSEGAGLAGWEWHRTPARGTCLAHTGTFFPQKKTRTPKSYMQHRWKTGRTALKDASGSVLRRFPGPTAPSPGWCRPLIPEHLPGKTLHGFPLPSAKAFRLFAFLSGAINTFAIVSFHILLLVSHEAQMCK